jgi:SsrA-binding protein
VAQSSSADVVRVLIDNRRARYEFHVLDTFEAGAVLLGSEVKSLRQGNANLQEAWIRLGDDGAWLVGCHVAPYVEANRQNHEPLRQRKLLLHHHELAKLAKGIHQQGLTAVPLKIYLKGSRIKVELALVRGKKLHDKRETIKARDAKREMDRARRRDGG